ncbi:MAG: hypothetical protein GH156_03105 [Dehalococcoidia bacterium]|nr:hypothetical protein [Dehalococcoidia bacterium]
MNSSTLGSRKIIVSATAIFVILLICAVVLSAMWPASWNPLLGSLLASIAVSFMAIVAGTLAAIFIVDRYLEHQRREAQKKEALQEAIYRKRWEAYIHGGLSVLSAVVTHLSLFVTYGKNKYLLLLGAEGDTSDVPDTIGGFVPWLIQNMQLSRKERVDQDADSSTDTTQHRGMTEQDAGRLIKEFEETMSSPITASRRDLSILLTYVNTLAAHLSDQLFLFQPFLDKRMELGVALVQFRHCLDDVAEGIEHSFLFRTEKGKGTSSFHLDEIGTAQFRTLGKKAIEVIRLIWADARA